MNFSCNSVLIHSLYRACDTHVIYFALIILTCIQSTSVYLFLFEYNICKYCYPYFLSKPFPSGFNLLLYFSWHIQFSLPSNKVGKSLLLYTNISFSFSKHSFLRTDYPLPAFICLKNLSIHFPILVNTLSRSPNCSSL